MWNKTPNLGGTTLFTFPHDPLPRRCKSIPWCLNSVIVVQIIWKTTKSKLSKHPDCSRLSGFKVEIMWPIKIISFVKGFVALQFIMTSSGGSSRLLVVCCCVSFASVFLYCIGYVRLELELRAYKERLETIEQREKQLMATPIPSFPTSGECIWRTMKSCLFVELLSRVY